MKERKERRTFFSSSRRRHQMTKEGEERKESLEFAAPDWTIRTRSGRACQKHTAHTVTRLRRRNVSPPPLFLLERARREEVVLLLFVVVVVSSLLPPLKLLAPFSFRVATLFFRPL